MVGTIIRAAPRVCARPDGSQQSVIRRRLCHAGDMANVSGGPTAAPAELPARRSWWWRTNRRSRRRSCTGSRRRAGRSRRSATGSPGSVRRRGCDPDVVVLDVMLPGIDGLEVCRRIQAERPVPVLMLTARDDETDMLIGLGVGADDYMTKPFSMRELVARTKALLRRTERATRAAEMAAAEQPDPPLVLGDVTVDRAQRRVLRGDTEVHLTPTEFDLLLALAATPRTVLTRERLLAEVWDWVDASGTRTVDSHIKALRRKLGPDLIRTVHGVGYAFEPSDGTPGPTGPARRASPRARERTPARPRRVRPLAAPGRPAARPVPLDQDQARRPRRGHRHRGRVHHVARAVQPPRSVADAADRDHRVARRHAAAGPGHDVAAAGDDVRGAADGRRRLQPPRPGDEPGRGGPAGGARSTRWPTTSSRPTCSGASSSPTSRTSCARR